MSISSILAFSVGLFGIFGKKIEKGGHSFFFFEEPDFTRL